MQIKLASILVTDQEQAVVLYKQTGVCEKNESSYGTVSLVIAAVFDDICGNLINLVQQAS